MNNEIKINVPEGMEIDEENSTFECIKFKPKWVPKRGDITVAGDYRPQIILVGEYIRKSNIIGFDVMCLAVLNAYDNLLTVWEHDEQPLWVEREASASEKELFIEKLNKQGYIYDSNDPRVIYKKEEELPKTWEEFCNNNPRREGEFYINDISEIRETSASTGGRYKNIDVNVLPSREYAEAMLALCKLIQLRNCYNDDWKPNWKSAEPKYAIRIYSEAPYRTTTTNTQCLLVFKTLKLRDEFYNNFKDLIEQAKLLL